MLLPVPAGTRVGPVGRAAFNKEDHFHSDVSPLVCTGGHSCLHSVSQTLRAHCLSVDGVASALHLLLAPESLPSPGSLLGLVQASGDDIALEVAHIPIF